MKNNKKLLAITSLAMLVSLGIAGTAMADTTSGTPATTTKSWANGGHMRGTKPAGNFVKPAAAGKVTAVNGNTITITTMARKTKSGTATTATTYTVDVTNAKITKGFGTNATTIAASAVAVGDFVSVQGTVSGTNVTATAVMDAGVRTAPVRPAAVGTVTAISGNTLTVTTPAHKGMNGTQTAATTYTVDATNAKITKGFGSNATILSVSNIAVNDMIVVQGTVSGTNIAATSIIDGIKFPTRPAGQNGGKQGMGNFKNMTHVMGTVQSVSGNSLVVAEGSVNYTVDATSAKISYGKNTAGTIANIETGDRVFILTPKVASGVTTVTATAIHDSTTH